MRREDFLIFTHNPNLVYLDTAATAQKPKSLIEAESHFLAYENGTVHRAVYSLAAKATDAHHAARTSVQQFIGAKDACEVLFTSGTTASINLVAFSFAEAFLTEGDEVVVTELEHHSNIVPWQMACERKKARLKIIPVNDRAELDLEAAKKLITPRTKLVACAYMSNAFGSIHPIREVIKLAHAQGAKVLIDAAQAISHIPIDVQELNCDFLAFSGHKIYGPTGVGVLYGKKELLEAMPPYQGGGDMIETVSFEKTTYAGLPNKFEAGTPAISPILGLKVALDYVSEVGLSKIAGHEMHLLQQMEEQVRDIPGLRMLSCAAKRGPLLSFVVEGVHHLDIGTFLDLKGICVRTGHMCAMPGMRRFGVPGAVRASIGLYNTEADVAAFASGLRDVIGKLR